MYNIFRRAGSQTWSVRFHVPRARRSDVGKAFGTKTGHKAEVVKTLGTSDRKEAMGRRYKALEDIRKEIDVRLQEIGLPPLHGDWQPDWAFPWAEDEQTIAEALEARKELAKASTREDQTEEVYTEDRNGLPHRTTIRTSERDRKTSDMLDALSDRADALQEAGVSAGPYIDRYKAIALGEATPMGNLIDRWLRDIDGTVKQQTLRGHLLSFRLLGEYLLSEEGEEDQVADAAAFIRTVAIESLSRRVISAFPEWLAQRKGLRAKTVQSRISPLKVFWGWAERKGYVTGVNPWLGATSGLKKRAEREEQTEDKPSAYQEEAILRLLQADPDAVKRWKYGPAIFDLLRLGLMTGARQNELCSLTRGRVIPPEKEGGLWAVKITSEVAKTRNALRIVPLHPLVQPIIARRVANAGSDADAPLFPELPPGGDDNKRSWTFAKRFGDFRKAVLGKDDPHNFHNLRGTFMTYFATAAGNGATACTVLIRDRLVGHVSQSLGDNTYVGQLDRSLYDRAVLDMVALGMPESVRRTLAHDNDMATMNKRAASKGKSMTLIPSDTAREWPVVLGGCDRASEA